MTRWNYKEWVDIMPDFMNGKSVRTFAPLTRSKLGIALDPAAREPRQQAHMQWVGAKARLDNLKAGEEPLKARMSELRRDLKRQTVGMEDLAPEDRHPDLRRLEISVDNAVAAYDKNRKAIRDLEDTVTGLEFESDDEISHRSILVLKQIEALREFLTEKETHYKVLAAFKHFELKCEDREVYYSVLAKLVKYLELQNSVPGNWVDLLPMSPEERDEWPPIFHAGGFTNRSLMPQTSTVPSDPDNRIWFFKDFWAGIDSSDLEEILGVAE